jgi:porin
MASPVRWIETRQVVPAVTALIALLFGAASPCPAQEESAEPPAEADGQAFAERSDTMRASHRHDPIEQHWHPFKEEIAGRGIGFELYYSADFFVNTRGGRNTEDAFQYRGLLDFGITLETEPLGLWSGGTFFVNFINNQGIDITERHVGDVQVVNNADAPNDTRLYEYWYQHALFDGRLRLKVGKMDANADFAGGLFRAEFVHSSPGVSPTIPMPTWPDSALGAVVFVEPVDWLYFNAGIFDARGTGTRSGFETAFHSPHESFTIFELGLRPTLSLFGQDDLPGQYAVGGWYHSGPWPVYFNDLGGRLAPRAETGNAGLYVTFDQLVYREPRADSEIEQGLGVFFQFGWAPSDKNEITQHYGAGFQYYGPIPGRDHDILGLGVHHVSLSGKVQSLEERYAETAIELFYKAQVTKWLSLKPDLHYIINPGGDGRDALVAGVRVEWTF